MKSIRRYLVIILLAAITLINFLAALQGYRAGMDQAEASFDQQLINIANIVSVVDTFENQEILEFTSDILAFQIWTSSRQLLEHSTGTPQVPITHFESGFNHANFSNYRWRTYGLFDELHQRWILVAQRMDSRYTLAESIIIESILPIAIGIPVAGLIIWFFVGSGLSPLYHFARQLHEKQAEDLTPVTLANPPQELEPVLQSTNQLLQRLSDLVTREKRFASDAAHELRTPISILKIHLHNLLHDHPEIRKQSLELQLSVERLEHLVDQILALYRCTPDQYIAKFEIVDLFKIAQEVVAQQYQSLEHRQQSIELLGKPVQIKANPFAIDTLMQNLLSNASKYSPENSELRITTGQKDGQPFICFEDSGPGIAKEEREQVFERFYRIPENQNLKPVIGCGLGLAIVTNIAQQHHAQIKLGSSSFSTGL
ncbi:MAG: ATP-binding protein, partial [Gammaproteobacteria bacterium]|nr:ATP-binding protein [Gammaproteobacteria bacterium]